jgi:hypothetical protein
VRWGRKLFAVALVAFAACRQLYGFEDPKPRVDAASDGHRDGFGSGFCNTTGLTCAGTAMAMSCNGCWVSCTETVSESTAKNRCQAWGGSIPLLNDTDFTTCVRTAVPTGDLWIGLEQASGQPSPAAGWTWLGGMTPLSTNWGTNEPDDENGTETGKAQCARLPDGSSKWDDFPCNTAITFACHSGG